MLPPRPSTSAQRGKEVSQTSKKPVTRSISARGDSDDGKVKPRLILNPNKKHKPESYDDSELDFCPLVFSSLERHLPQKMLSAPREDKLKYMREILVSYMPPGSQNRDQKRREYKERIISLYQPLHRELYTIDPTTFFIPTFLKAINDNTVESFRSIMSQPIPGIFTFEMLQPRFCELLLSEVENFERWVKKAKFRIMRPNILNKYGVVLDDFGLQTMLDKLMEDFISPLSKVFYPEVGGSTLDSHHGFIVEYGVDRDVELGLHVDDSEVTLNVCLGRQFSGGELFFRGMRCDKHLDTRIYSEETFDYSHVPGRAVLHHGRYRHGARATTAGYRVNLLLWCKSSIYREMKRYQEDFSSWCGECKQVKQQRKPKLLLSREPTGSVVLSKRGGETDA